MNDSFEGKSFSETHEYSSDYMHCIRRYTHVNAFSDFAEETFQEFEIRIKYDEYVCCARFQNNSNLREVEKQLCIANFFTFLTQTKKLVMRFVSLSIDEKEGGSCEI